MFRTGYLCLGRLIRISPANYTFLILGRSRLKIHAVHLTGSNNLKEQLKLTIFYKRTDWNSVYFFDTSSLSNYRECKFQIIYRQKHSQTVLHFVTVKMTCWKPWDMQFQQLLDSFRNCAFTVQFGNYATEYEEPAPISKRLFDWENGRFWDSSTWCFPLIPWMLNGLQIIFPG